MEKFFFPEPAWKVHRAVMSGAASAQAAAQSAELPPEYVLSTPVFYPSPIRPVKQGRTKEGGTSGVVFPEKQNARPFPSGHLLTRCLKSFFIFIGSFCAFWWATAAARAPLR